MDAIAGSGASVDTRREIVSLAVRSKGSGSEHRSWEAGLIRFGSDGVRHGEPGGGNGPYLPWTIYTHLYPRGWTPVKKVKGSRGVGWI